MLVSMILTILNKAFTWLMLFVILLNINQRKYKSGGSKRRATLLIAFDILMLYLLLILRDHYKLPSFVDYILLAVSLIIPVVSRKYFWPFRLHCRKCGKTMGFDEIIGEDDNLCHECFLDEHPEIKKKEEEKKLTPEERIDLKCKAANTVDEVPWDYWEPTERCTLTYLFDGDKVLLIEKKRGMGTGYYNAPGGHIELEETKYEAAVREAKEETGLDMSNLKERGTLYFQFKDGIRMIGYVFFAYKYSGELIKECDETRPFWCNLNDLDYSKMWEDDKLWLPLALSGKKFEGYFIFDDLKLLDSKVVTEDE